MKANDTDKLLDNANEILSAVRYMESVDADAACERSLQAIRQSRRNIRISRMLRFAACLSLPLSIATGVLAWLLFFPSESERYVEVTSPVGAVIKYELPDNSIVWLNSGSKLSYPAVFSRKSRQVRLEGEAYFQVEANPEKPFYVRTSGDCSVKVYGTEFVVSAYPDDPTVTTTLESGAVDMEVGAGSEARSVTMVPGDQAVFTKTTGTMEKYKVNAYEFSAWREGKMIFRNATLDEIFNTLERKFGVDIQVRGNRSGEERYRATFRNESLDRTLNYLARIAGFSWRCEDDRLIEVELD